MKNSEILELLIYGAYIEEQSKLEETELNIFKDVANHYYQEGIKEVNETLPKKKRKQPSIIPDAIFLALMDMQPIYNGYTFKQNIEIMIRYNAEQIYKQCLINIMQGKENNIDDPVIQNIIKKQQNTKLCINGDKISGSTDLTMIGINNKCIVEGIKSIDKNAKVQFISDRCDNVTPMCMNMDRMIFNVNDYNEFIRYVGTSIKDIRQEKVKVFGLVQGINAPPINNFFHWCHSYLMYVKPVEKQDKTEYNGLGSSNENTLQNHPKPELLEKIDYNNKSEVIECLKKYEKIIQNDKTENAIVITKNGEVYQCFGKNNNVWPDYDLKNKLKGAYVTHNHPKKETEYSFSESDLSLFNEYNLKVLRGKDYKYTYELNRNSKDIDTIDIFNMTEEDGIHALNISRAKKYKIGYRRWKND